MKPTRLGRTTIDVSPLGTGTWAWGDKTIWGYGGEKSDIALREAFQTSVRAGVSFFDTAEVYGKGRSELLLGAFARELSANVVLATKFMPYPWRLNRKDLLSSLRASLKRLGCSRIDLYQIHWPVHIVPMVKWLDAMVEALDLNLIRAVGVSNYSEAQMERAHAWLTRRGVPLASNQVEYSLIHRKPERNGVLEMCRELGITLIAYSPLGMGVLSGKYSATHAPPGMRGLRYSRRFLGIVGGLLERIAGIGRRHGGKTTAQVSLNWLLRKGVLPIPGAKSAAQAEENAGAMGWELDDGEVEALEDLSRKVQR